MSFNKVNFDNSTNLQKKLEYQQSKKLENESINPGKYQLNTPVNKGECYLQQPTIRLQKRGVSVSKHYPLIDIDSELIGLNTNNKNHELKHFDDCYIAKEYTRLSNPPCTLRGVENGFNRWEWLCKNPQKNIFREFPHNVNNRLLVKDNHRPCIPQPIDQTLGLPNINTKLFCEKLTPVCSVPTDEASVQWKQLKK